MKLRKREDLVVQQPATVVADPGESRPTSWRPLGELLVARSAIRPEQVTAALAGQSDSGRRLGRLLVERGVLQERELTAVLAEQCGLPLLDLRSSTPSADAVALVPDRFAREHQCVPVSLDADVLLVAAAEPSDHLRALLETRTGRRVELGIAGDSAVRRAVDSTYRSLGDIQRQVVAFEASGAAAVRRTASRTDVGPDDAPVVQVVNMIITQALRDRASDIHVEPQGDRVRVRVRIDGALHETLTLPESIGPGLVSRIKIMAGMNIVERRRPQDGQIAMVLDDREVDIRVSSTGTVFGEKVVMRLLDKTRSVHQLDSLGMSAETHAAFSRLIHAPFGMVVCAGPTGSGKTTTLYAALTEINSVDRNITTIEDPVEYVFPTLTQIQINEAAGVTFAGGLKAILRQDPDVILVGEVRDAETGRIAVQSALTGHLVMSSVHATDAISALYRFLDMGIESFLVASSVRAVVAQRLVRRNCDYCRVSYTPTPEELAFYVEAGGRPTSSFSRGAGCNFCADTGYSDRIGVYELMEMSEEMRQLVVEPHPSHDEMRALAMKQGMRTLREQGVALVQDEVTTIAEIIRTIYTH